MKRILLLILFLPIFTQAQIQEELSSKIQGYFDRIQKEYPTEKAYLHLDKRTYTLGDDLWFSTYVTAGSTQIPSPLSKTLYVDIFDGDGMLLEQRKVQLENGRGYGDYKIPRFGKPGQYQIKAYTAWMRNFGEDFFHSTAFNVIDAEGGSFLPQVTFREISASNGQVKYLLDVQAADQSGNPLANKSLEIIAWGDQEKLTQQPLQLNAQGQASFSLNLPEKPFKSQFLELVFAENESYTNSQRISIPYSLNLVDIQFLPEGGHWVVGKKSTLAFRAIAPNGTPVELKGILGEQEFKSLFGGMGKIEFTPEKSDYSTELIDLKYGQKRTITLPKADQEGLAMQVVNNPAASYLTVLVQGNIPPQNLLLVSQTRGLINYMIQGTLNNGVWGVRIPKENLIAGINQITVLNGDGAPLLERLVFIQPKEILDLSANLSGNLNSREKLQITLSNQVLGNPAEGTFSLSITDADQVKDETNTFGSIFSDLLLTSDLKGKLYQPGYYFKDQEVETLEALDLVMLTHGWRRFSWENVIAQEFPKLDHFIESGITIEGQITEQQETKKGLSGGKVSAIVGEGIEIISSEFGPNGRFILRDLVYQDTATVAITAEDNRAKNFIDIEVVRPEAVFQKIAGIYPPQIEWPAALIATFRERNLQQQLNEDPDILDLEGVTVEAQTIEREEEEVRKVYGSGDVSINPDKIPGNVAFTNVFQLIQGRVAGVQVFVSGLDVSVQIRGVGSINSGTTPLFLLDNMPVDAATLLQVNPRDVASVDVFKDPARAAIFGSQGANGVIAVYTKSGAGISGVTIGGTLVTQYGGYSSPREFYAPQYETKTVENAAADKRATIFWAPKIEIDSSGRAEVEFYNTDIAKRHLLILEGIDMQGRLGRFVKILE